MNPIPIIAITGHEESLKALKEKEISNIKSYFLMPLDPSLLNRAVCGALLI